jgi:hypothetical protein
MITIRPIHSSDARSIAKIAWACHLPISWRWDPKSNGAVAVHDGVVVAFASTREIPWGLCMEEWWCYPTPSGRAGLLALGRWSEDVAQRLADERGVSVGVGGVVRLDNPLHAAALRKRGYAVDAEVYVRQMAPKQSPKDDLVIIEPGENPTNPQSVAASGG